MALIVNTRSLGAPLTGVQRYLLEILNYFNSHGFEYIKKGDGARQGIGGHLWEQTALPMASAGSLLWSPCNSGPIIVSRQVITIHDIGPIVHPEWWSDKYAKWYGYMQPKVAKTALHVITDSNFSKSQIVERFSINENMVSVVHLAPQKRFSNVSNDEMFNLKLADFKRKLNLPDGRLLLVLGSLDPRKNIENLLKGWRAALKALPKDYYLLVVGGLPAANIFGVREANRSEERVIFTGRLDDIDLPYVYYLSDYFIAPSLYEGFGLPPLEAMSCSLPVAASSIETHKEILGEAAIYFDPRSVKSIMNSIVEISQIIESDEHEKYIRNAAEQSLKYSWEKTGKATKECLEMYI